MSRVNETAVPGIDAPPVVSSPAPCVELGVDQVKSPSTPSTQFGASWKLYPPCRRPPTKPTSLVLPIDPLEAVVPVPRDGNRCSIAVAPSSTGVPTEIEPGPVICERNYWSRRRRHASTQCQRRLRSRQRLQNPATIMANFLRIVISPKYENELHSLIVAKKKFVPS